MTRRVDYPSDHPGDRLTILVRQGDDDVRISYEYGADDLLTKAARQMPAVAAAPAGGVSTMPRPGPRPHPGPAMRSRARAWSRCPAQVL